MAANQREISFLILFQNHAGAGLVGLEFKDLFDLNSKRRHLRIQKTVK